MSARALAVLDRLPLHLAAADPEKRFELVVSGITDSLEVLTRQVGDVRRAHRLSEAPTVGDVRALAALHGLGSHAWDLLMLRLDALDAAARRPPRRTPGCSPRCWVSPRSSSPTSVRTTASHWRSSPRARPVIGSRSRCAARSCAP